MKIDLREIPSFVINLKKDKNKRAHVEAVFGELGIANYTIVPAVETEPGRFGCCLSHIRAMNAAGRRFPYVIYEDDISPTEDFTPVIEVPEEADAVHLGACDHGLVPDYNANIMLPGAALVSPYAKGFLRAYNMASRHAILYLNEQFAMNVRRASIDALVRINQMNGSYGDVGLAELQRNATYLVVEKPFFYQDATYGGQEEQTLLQLQAPSLAPVLEFTDKIGPQRCVLEEKDGQPWWRRIKPEKERRGGQAAGGTPERKG